MWISKRLYGLVAALEGLVEAVSKDDQIEIVRHMGYVTDLRKDIESHWEFMDVALRRAEQTLQKIGDLPVEDIEDVALHEANYMRSVLAMQEETDEPA